MAGAGAVSTAVLIGFLNDHFVGGDGNFLFASKLILHRVDDVVRHERFAVVFADVTVRGETGFGAEIARKLPGVIVLNDDDLFAPGKDASLPRREMARSI